MTSEQKVVLITGGARGIGAQTARLAVERGYAVAVNFRERADAAAQLVAELTGAGGNAVAIQCDVADADAVSKMFREVDEHFGRLDALVNSAGIDGNRSDVAGFTGAGLRRLFEVNVVGTMLCCREAVERMSTAKRGRGGAIVNVSSMSATIGGRAGSCDYAASKAAVDTFTVGLAKEVAEYGIRANALRPGMTMTDMTRSVNDDPELLRSISQTIAMNRIAQAHEIAQPILWLLSDEASFISGACIDASGGGFIIGERIA